jgi:hypothetical protein
VPASRSTAVMDAAKRGPRGSMPAGRTEAGAEVATQIR